MIKHIVLWKLKDQVDGKSRQDNAAILKQQLENLKGNIPGLLRIEVGININKTGIEDDADVVLYSEFENQSALDAYYVHPEHVKIVPFAKAIRSERRIIDYKTD